MTRSDGLKTATKNHSVGNTSELVKENMGYKAYFKA